MLARICNTICLLMHISNLLVRHIAHKEVRLDIYVHPTSFNEFLCNKINTTNGHKVQTCA